MKKLSVVGIGPGNESYLSISAKETLKDSDLIVGYSKYVELVKEYFPEKNYLSTSMTKEVDRCRMALEKASEDNIVSVVCSGDAGVYGMAALVYELSVDFPDVDINIVPGISAVLSGSAVLGAPIGHDFAVISLSDLLTPWELIEKRLRLAGEGDFCICLYNPSSHKRKDYLKRACEILLNFKEEDTICGYVRNIGRIGEEYHILSLLELKEIEVDMFTTVFIGNSNTKVINNKMVTPRGYKGI
ncbi:cobalt-precorrin 3 C17-methyltransferase [Methanobrevibacter olleyae]|uniref:Cobalt-precorrin 3 C17-methyltransferase n=1 Tax=Methanobrevibacter olleyae TaxID=294671 RepID=A0A1I4H1E1_METOL|nr:precorrin-3B C(17)-methyltransferase [Methanobrevibacter olleyae]SFL36108.1 cobalt-precorrin 3 C17-methyltransferase [Methanobrevibacter olleyae]